MGSNPSCATIMPNILSCVGEEEEKAEFGHAPITAVTLVKNKTALVFFLVVQYLLCRVLAELRVSVRESAVALSDLTLAHSHHSCGA